MNGSVRKVCHINVDGDNWLVVDKNINARTEKGDRNTKYAYGVGVNAVCAVKL